MKTVLSFIFSLGLKPLYRKHYEFYIIVNDFREKLPRIQNLANKISDREVESMEHLSEIHKLFTIVDLSSQKVYATNRDIDLFYNRLNNFDFRFIVFKEYYRKYISNVNRLNPQATDSNLDIAILRDLLSNEERRPLKPLQIFLYHLKWEYKLTSQIYQLYIKS